MGKGNTPCDDGDDLPLFSEDVFIQILLWVPVISLLRFKSVCKSWRALIQSSFFIDLHTFKSTSSSNSSKFGTFILQAIQLSDNILEGEIKSFMLSSDESEHALKVDHLGFSPFYKDFQQTNTIRMVGSCNGLICLHDSKLRVVSLWNPATRQFRILPKSITIEDKLFARDFVAFGFDVKAKDYKVVWIARDRHRGGMVCKCRVQVYSLRTDSWRLLEGIHSLPALPNEEPYLNHGIYLNGSYFFVGRDIARNSTWEFREDGTPIPISNNSLMLSFDFTEEIFTTMQFPDHDCRHKLVLSYLGDKMALFIARKSVLTGYESCREGDEDYDYYDIWMLNEHSSSSSSSSAVNKDSWTHLHSFRIRNSREKPPSQPRCISNNGEFALITIKTGDGKKLQCFNLVTKEVKMDFKICDGVVNADVYKQSLVSIIGVNGGAATTSPANRDRVACGAITVMLFNH